MRDVKPMTPNVGSSMKRIFAVAISLALLVATPGLATADSTHQQAINLVI